MITVKNLEIENPNFTNPPTEITLETPLTILAGANGSGKSTLLTAIKNAVKKSYKNQTDRYHFNIVHHIQHLINVLLMQNQSFTNKERTKN